MHYNPNSFNSIRLLVQLENKIKIKIKNKNKKDFWLGLNHVTFLDPQSGTLIIWWPGNLETIKPEKRLGVPFSDASGG
jgi:hypothetical protein